MQGKKMDALSSHELLITVSQNCLTLLFKQEGYTLFAAGKEVTVVETLSQVF